MHNPAEYVVSPESTSGSAIGQDIAERVYDLVWRLDFTAPGFAVIDISPGMDSHSLRSLMVVLKQRFSEIAVRRGRLPFVYRSMGRFDQQETTKFHLDGAPEQSLLMLGYEPSKVRSRLFLADNARAAFDLGITPEQFLKDWNPMYKKGEEFLAPYVTEVPQPDEGHSRILLINNSSMAFTEARSNPLGVMHKAIIESPDSTQRRIVNSTMLVKVGEEVSADKQAEFVATDMISEKL
ncbi:MAG: hypothetical protein ACKV0T_19695 [Planctomycetales bacterium]